MNFDLGFYWALFLRRLPVMALFVLLFSGLGIVTALKLPETYSTSARLLVEAPQIPTSMVTSIVQTGPAEQLAVIEQRLMTRANLIDIANRYNVFENMRDMEPDNVTARMKDATQIRRRAAGRGEAATMMVISFEARSPQIAANVVNEYVTLVLQENSRFRVARAENTLDFFEQEVSRLDDELTRQSVEIARFKSENANSLPQDQAYRLGRQNLLQERVDRLGRELAFAKQQRENIEQNFAASRKPQPDRLSKFEQELIVSRAEFDRLSETYDDSNPRIIRLKDKIARLEAIVATQNATALPEGDAPEIQALLNAAIKEADSRIEALETQIEATTTELEELNKNISRSSANATQLAELERDLKVVQSRYNSAVANLNTARMSERVESTAQGQRINVIENATIPQIPSGPNRLLIAAIGIFSGIGLAVGYFVLLETLNRDIRRPAELSERFNVMPIATIPYMESRAAQFMRRGVLVVAMVAVLIGVPLALWYIDTYYLPLEVIVQKSLTKLGLG